MSAAEGLCSSSGGVLAMPLSGEENAAVAAAAADLLNATSGYVRLGMRRTSNTPSTDREAGWDVASGRQLTGQQGGGGACVRVRGASLGGKGRGRHACVECGRVRCVRCALAFRAHTAAVVRRFLVCASLHTCCLQATTSTGATRPTCPTRRSPAAAPTTCVCPASAPTCCGRTPPAQSAASPCASACVSGASPCARLLCAPPAVAWLGGGGAWFLAPHTGSTGRPHCCSEIGRFPRTSTVSFVAAWHATPMLCAACVSLPAVSLPEQTTWVGCYSDSSGSPLLPTYLGWVGSIAGCAARARLEGFRCALGRCVCVCVRRDE